MARQTYEFGQPTFWQLVLYRVCFYHLIYGKLKAQAVREAKRLGLTKKTDIKKYVDEYIKQGYDETGLRGVNEEALRYAEENTFTNELVGFTDKFADLVNSQPYLKQFFPFVKHLQTLQKQ